MAPPPRPPVARAPLPRPGLPAPRPRTPPRFPWTTIAVVAGLACFGMYAWGWLISGSAVGVAMIEIPLLLLLTAPLFLRAARNETRFDLGGLLAFALIVRFAAAYYRFTNAADGLVYHQYGAELAKSFRQFNFDVDPLAPVPGTGGMRIVAGVVEVITNSSMFGSFLLFAWLSFLGCWFFYRAFVTAMPDADHKRYALLIFLFPTLVFWPSSMGKDSWMVFTLGIASFGAARILVRARWGFTLFVVGLLAGSLVRPHVVLLLAGAFAVAFLIGRRSERPGALTPTEVAKAGGLVVLIAVGAYLATRAGKILDTTDIGTALDATVSRTNEGGSTFSPADPANPIGYVEAFVTVLFRPFVFEAHNAESLFTSIESLFLIGLFVASWKRLVSIPKRLRSQPYVGMAIAYILMFVFAFGTIANFGILARQRSQVLPFMFVLLSVLPVVASVARPAPPTPRLARPRRP
jgi:hypothetical protein